MKTPSHKKKTIKAWLAVNPTKYDDRYQHHWFDIGDFTLNHKTSLFLKKSQAEFFIENRVNWIVTPCEITYSLPTPRVKKNK